MDLDFAILADGVTERQDAKLDIYGAGFDTVGAPAVPARHPRLTLALRVLLSAHEASHPHGVDVVLQAADGQEIMRGRGEVHPMPPAQASQIPAGRQVGVGLILNFENVVFPQFGPYQLAILWDGNEARPPLRLFVEQTPPGP